MRGPPVIRTAALADHNQLRLERELAGRDGGHPISTTLNSPASTHRSSEAAGLHRTTGTASTPGVPRERTLGDLVTPARLRRAG
ncbi:MAG TPA: hypothetical protein VGF65_06620, partial [Mycobacterium sp.]